MSYFPIDTDNEKLTNEEERVISMNDEQKKGTSYARHVKPHTEATKRLISQSQLKRYDLLRELAQRGQMTEDRIREIVKETIERYLKNNNTIEIDKRT